MNVSHYSKVFLKKISNFSSQELQLITKGVLLRGYAVFYSLWTYEAICTFFYLSAFYPCLYQDIFFMIGSALALLFSRASSVRKDASYLFLSEKTIVVIIWALMISFLTYNISNFFSYFSLPPNIAHYATLLTSLCTFTPFGQGHSSIWALVWALFLLDTVPSIRGYGHATLQALRMVLQRFPLFLVYTLFVSTFFQSLLWIIQKTLLSLTAAQCILDLLMLPWHTAAIAQVYSYIRHSEE